MASSRWKRFAFFERSTLDVPPEVIDDLIPVDGVSRDNRRSVKSLKLAGKEVSNDSVILIVTTAALPLYSKPTEVRTTHISAGQRKKQETKDDSISAMWSSLTACTVPAFAEEGNNSSGAAGEALAHGISMPSQAQLPRQGMNGRISKALKGASMDGLVLSFVTSRSTEFVHCVDVTVRCNPPRGKESLEDLDGWRGYFSPFLRTPGDRSGTTSETPMVENTNHSDVSVLGIAACRMSTGGQIVDEHDVVHLVCISAQQICVWEDPHIHLSCRRPLTPPPVPSEARTVYLQSSWRPADGNCRVVDIIPGIVAVGTDTGAVLILTYSPDLSVSTSRPQGLRTYLRIPPPPTQNLEVVSVKISLANDKASVFVAYNFTGSVSVSQMSTAGVCCYDFPVPTPSSPSLSAPSARHDLDGRYVGSSTLVDALTTQRGLELSVARPDGLYSYSQTERIGVAPVDGTKLALCLIPPTIPMERTREVDLEGIPHGYALVASTDAKSGRDAVDIYDSTNKLVAFHLLLSPGHRAVRTVGITTPPVQCTDGGIKGGRSSALVLTSGGSFVTLTEKLTDEKISLLVQKNLFSAAIVVAYADPSYQPEEISQLYRQYAEHLYHKGDFSAAIDQYIHTIGSLESSHVIFRYLDAPKIPLLVKYLESLRSRDLATAVHNELLRTCHLKMNDREAAEAIITTSSSIDKVSLSSILTNISSSPKEALATICSLDARQTAEIVIQHGASLTRVLPREMAGIVISLCVGTYSPKGLADAASAASTDLNRMIAYATDDKKKACEPFPANLFASAFVEHPKMLRLVLAHCNRNKCVLTPSLRRTLLELTLAEWNQAKRSGDTEAEKLRHKEAIAALTDSHSREIGDYDALVIVQSASFDEGELLLYERLQMAPLLLDRYAKDGGEKSRRQMLAMCQSDPEILADVMGRFVDMAGRRLSQSSVRISSDYDSDFDESEEILNDIQEALALARRQRVIPPVRITRILAGEGIGQFTDRNDSSLESNLNKRTVPLSVALEYVGTILEESRREISRLKAEVEEYNQMCNSMATEIESLLRASHSLPSLAPTSSAAPRRLNIDGLYAKIRSGENENYSPGQPREAFWRDMVQSEDKFDTIARFFAKGVIS